MFLPRARHHARTVLNPFFPAPRPSARRGAGETPPAAPEALEARTLLTAAPLDTLAGYGEEGAGSELTTLRDGYKAQIFTVSGDASLATVSFVVRPGSGSQNAAVDGGSAGAPAYSGEWTDSFRVLLVTVGPDSDFDDPDFKTVLASVDADAAGDPLRVRDVYDGDGDGLAGELVTVDFAGSAGAADLRAGETLAFVIDSASGGVEAQSTGAGRQVSLVTRDRFGDDPGGRLLSAGGSKIDGLTTAEALADDSVWGYSFPRPDLRFRLTFGEAGAGFDRPPVAVAAASNLTEGGVLTLDGTGTADEDPAGLTYAWDLDGDGDYDDASGALAEVGFEDYVALQPFPHNPDDDYRTTFTAALRVTDAAGRDSFDAATFRLRNAPPALADSVTDFAATEGEAVTLDLAAVDPNPLDRIDYWLVDWGDGTEPERFDGQAPTAAHTYADDGVYTVSLSVRDRDAGFRSVGFGGRQAVLYDLGAVTATVADALPDVTAEIVGLPDPAAGPIDEGAEITLTAAGADNRAGGPLAFEWELFLPGFTTAGEGTGTGGTFTFRAPDEGNWSVRLTATAADGSTAEVVAALPTIVNLPPVVSDPVMTSGPAAAVEGGAVDFTAAAYDPGPNDRVTTSWETQVFEDGAWRASSSSGGGSGRPLSSDPAAPTVFDYRAGFPEDGRYRTRFTARNTSGADGTREAVSAWVEYDVANVAPTAELAEFPPVAEGGTVRLAGAATDPAGSYYGPGLQILDHDPLTFSLTVTDADGNVVGDSRGDDALDFTPADSGAYTVTFTAADDDGGVTTVTRTLVVANLDPSVAVDGPRNGEEGTAVTFTATGSDPAGAADPLTYAWTVTAGGAVVETGTGESFTFTPADDGEYAVAVTADDGDGGTATDSLTLAVANVAPTATIAGLPTDAVEGSPVTLTAVGSDPAGDADPLTYFWTVLSPDGFTFAQGAGETFTFTPADDGAYTVELGVQDDEFGASLTTATVQVANVAPTLAVDVLTNEPEGKRLVLGVSATDPGADTVSEIVVNWGDGATATFAAGETIAHAYADDGTYTVSVSVTDEDGTFAAEPFSLFVGNLDPVIGEFAGTELILRGGTASFAGTATDPGVLDVLTATLDWGDGTSDAVAVNPDGAFALDHGYAVAGDYTVTLTVTDGDGGTATATAELSVKVAAILDDALYGGAALFVAGTAGDDVLTVRRNDAGRSSCGNTAGSWAPSTPTRSAACRSTAGPGTTSSPSARRSPTPRGSPAGRGTTTCGAGPGPT